MKVGPKLAMFKCPNFVQLHECLIVIHSGFTKFGDVTANGDGFAKFTLVA